MEQLDHRQLLSVNFTGNVPIDFPATQSPGVVILPDNPLVQHPAIAPQIAPIVKVSGFDISAVRVSYTPATDTLSIGLEQPPSQNQPGQVIAGDADNNGNSGTVNPAVTSTPGFGGFQDPADFGGTESMGAFLDFSGTGTPQVVAGFSSVPPTPTGTDPSPQKPYQVALAIPTGPNAAPAFGTELPQFEGNFYLNNSSAHPNFEFDIRNFSQLYTQITGQPLSSSTEINLGAFGGSGQDIGIGEAFFPAQAFTVANATVPPTGGPVSPPILVNPHEHRIVDTLHRDLVRVYVIGTSGFDPTTINPATVQFAGASPVANFTRHFSRLEFPVETFVFVANQMTLPPGQSTATFTAKTNSGQDVSSSKIVLNIPNSSKLRGELGRLMGSQTIYPRLPQVSPTATQAATSTPSGAATVRLQRVSQQAAQAVRVNYRAQVSNSGTTTPVAMPRQVVSLNQASPTPINLATGTSIPRNLGRSLNDYLNQGSLSAV